ncbi:MAG: hypothetical protein QHC40_07055 [Sphingobium sp.]|nr:hypothetical protein [Sphingobium sp.]
MNDRWARAVRHVDRAAADDGAAASGRAQFRQSHPNRHRNHSCYFRSSPNPAWLKVETLAMGLCLSSKTQNKALTATALTLNAGPASSENIRADEGFWLTCHYETDAGDQVKAKGPRSVICDAAEWASRCSWTARPTASHVPFTCGA